MSVGSKKQIVIREVWAHNVYEEFLFINSQIPKFSFVSMDTEFPGTIFNFPTGYKEAFRRLKPSDFYDIMKANVDALNFIQLGLTLSNDKGELPNFGTDTYFIWQFNFNFDLSRDLYAHESIEFLKKQGIDFDKNRDEGINLAVFTYLFSNSRLVCRRYPVTWITFHGAYDFAYLIKLLSRSFLPDELNSFMELVKYFFGERVYDVKYMMKFCKSLYGGLEQVAKKLKVDRAVGKGHHAGSDSLLTWQTYLKMNELFFHGENWVEEHGGVLFGFEVKEN